MTAKELAAELLKTPNAVVLLQTANGFAEVAAVAATGVHRNAVALVASDGKYDLNLRSESR